MKEKVEGNRELAFLSRQLATIIVDIDFDEDLDAMVLEQNRMLPLWRRSWKS